MAETTLAKSIFDKLMNRKDRDDSFEREALNNCGGLIEMDQHGCQGGSIEGGCSITSMRLSSQKYLKVFEREVKFEYLNGMGRAVRFLSFSEYLQIDNLLSYGVCSLYL